MREIELKDVPWITEAANRLRIWLTENGDWLSPTSIDEGTPLTNEELPRWYYWCVQWITYEGLFTTLWREKWFEQGIKAFGLLALEHNGVITARMGESGLLFVSCQEGEPMPVEDFLNGNTLEFRFDPEFSDLDWSPVETVGHILAEFYPS